MIYLDRLTDNDECKQYIDHLIDEYAVQIKLDMDSARLPDRIALDYANSSILSLLPKGCETPGNYICSIIAKNNKIGYLWYSINPILNVAYIHDIHIFKEFRRKGFGIATLKQLENSLLGEGCNGVCLRCSVLNSAAIRLYEKAGFTNIGFQMFKQI